MNLRVDTTTKQVSRNLNKMGDQAARARPAFVKIADYIAAQNAAKWGKGWKRNAPATLAAKARKGQGSVPLTATGASKAQLTNGKRATLRVTDNQLDLGSNRVGMIFAKRGTKYAPKRNPLRYGKAAREDAARTLLKHTIKGNSR